MLSIASFRTSCIQVLTNFVKFSYFKICKDFPHIDFFTFTSKFGRLRIYSGGGAVSSMFVLCGSVPP